MNAPPELPLGLQILLHSPRRLAVSLAGMTLAVVLMATQYSFRNGLFDSQTRLIQRLDGPLMIVSRLKYLMYAPEPFPQQRVAQARAVPGVAEVRPLYMETIRSVWKNSETAEQRQVRVLAFDPDRPPLYFPEVAAHADELKLPNTVMFDARSREEFGRPEPGSRTELSGRQVEVVGTFELGTDFLSDGSVITSDRNFLKFFADPREADPERRGVDVGVVLLEPGADVRDVQQRLREALLDDVAVLTREELADVETAYWQNNTAIGYVFTLGTVVGFAVGIIICYQILYANVSSYLPQFATMKAMGFSNGYLVGVVFQQGLFLAVLGFVPGLALTHGVFWVVIRMTGLPMSMGPDRLAVVFLLTLVMCLLSGGMAVRRVIAADPAEVFR